MCEFEDVQISGLSIVFPKNGFMLCGLVKIGAGAVAKAGGAARRGTNVVAVFIKHFYQFIAAGAEEVNAAAAIIPCMYLQRRIGLWKLFDRIYFLLYTGRNNYFIFLALREQGSEGEEEKEAGKHM